jgi:hypothetical protein
MAIADDISIDVSGNITHTANTNHYTVLELHRFLQNLADDEYPATASDVVDITSLTPSERSTDGIITLINGFNIDDDASEYFYGGSITQDGGDTVYSGLKVLGAVNDSNTQIQVIQDHDYYDTTSPFWGDQSGGGYNGDAVSGVLMRILVKTRVGGADIDGKKARVQIRAWGDTYDFFNVTLGEGESVAAVSSTPDAQNNIAIGTVQAWAGGDIPTNDSEGWNQIDINNGNGNKEYYSKWHYNSNALAMKATWNWIKEITGNDSPETSAGPYGFATGETFLGITHSWAYDGLTGTFSEEEKLYWGTKIVYNTLTGTFAAGDYVIFKTGATWVNAGKVLYDNGTTEMFVALESTATITAADTIDNVDQDADAIVATVTNNDKTGGEGILLAENTTDDDMYIQLISGGPPVDNLPIWGFTSNADCLVFGSVTAQTVPKVALGSYTGSLIGAFGIGVDADDLTSTDSVQPLVGAAQTPPNNVTFILSGLISGDRILIGNKDTGNDFEWTEMTLAAALDTGTETIVDVGAGNIPADAPATGVLRVTLDDGRHRRIAYTGHDGDDEFTIGSSDWLDPDDAAIGKGVMLAFIDKQTALTQEEFTLQYDATRTLWIRVREGTSATPIKTYEGPGTLGATGGSATVGRIDDY